MLCICVSLRLCWPGTFQGSAKVVGHSKDAAALVQVRGPKIISKVIITYAEGVAF